MVIKKALGEDVEDIALVESICFEAAEAAPKKEFEERVKYYGNHFLLMYDNDKLIAFVDGFVTDERDLTDEMFHDASMHKEQGKWQMLFGVNTLPEYRNKGIAKRLLLQFVKEAKLQGREGVVLTCKEEKLHYYAKFGFISEGLSKSEHGNAKWYQMRLTFSTEHVKFDMHCHTAEGSVDSNVTIEDYIQGLKQKGYGGMLITDHDSFAGYEAYAKKETKDPEFVVLRGIEYDTYEYGHFLIILPEDFPKQLLPLFSCRGLTLWKLIHLVHGCGGIVGPAHPGGEPFLSFSRSKFWKRLDFVTHMLKFDFIEGYNACEDGKSNATARSIAKKYNIPLFAGSDSHREECVGLAYTKIPDYVKTESDLITYVKHMNFPRVGGTHYGRTIKDKLGKVNLYLVVSFFFYNKFLAFKNMRKRDRLIFEVMKYIAGKRINEMLGVDN